MSEVKTAVGPAVGPHSHDAPLVGVLMGSSSDWDVMKNAVAMLQEFGVPYEAKVVSAHRMPDEMLAYGREAADRGLSVLIADSLGGEEPRTHGARSRLNPDPGLASKAGEALRDRHGQQV